MCCLFDVVASFDFHQFVCRFFGACDFTSSLSQHHSQASAILTPPPVHLRLPCRPPQLATSTFTISAGPPQKTRTFAPPKLSTTVSPTVAPLKSNAFYHLTTLILTASTISIVIPPPLPPSPITVFEHHFIPAATIVYPSSITTSIEHHHFTCMLIPTTTEKIK